MIYFIEDYNQIWADMDDHVIEDTELIFVFPRFKDYWNGIISYNDLFMDLVAFMQNDVRRPIWSSAMDLTEDIISVLDNMGDPRKTFTYRHFTENGKNASIIGTFLMATAYRISRSTIDDNYSFLSTIGDIYGQLYKNRLVK